MSPIEDYDVVVLGSGEAGKYLAWHFASTGERAIVVERRYVGGSCPNIACLPSKNIVYSAKVASLVRRSEEFGIFTDSWRVDMAGVRARKRKMVEGLVEMHFDKYRKSGAELALGEGKLIGPKTVEVALSEGGRRVLRGRRLVICTGSRAKFEPIPGLRESAPLTHIEALELDQLPERLLVLGGGYIGLEFAQAMQRLGSQVAVIERNAALAHREDTDVSAALGQLFADEGIEVRAETVVSRVEGKSGSGVRVYATQRGVETVIEGSHLLVAGGRTPNTDGIGLETAGIERTERGFIKVNERLETTAPDVWAVGDCAGSPHFTHIAFDDYRIVRDNIAGGHRVTTGRQVPSCMFTDPELARIGLTEREATARGTPFRLARLSMIGVLRTRTLSETRGFMKALVGMDDRILGFTAFGVEAGEMLPVVQMVMSAGLPYTVLKDAIFTHPTMNEGLNTLFSNVPAK